MTLGVVTDGKQMPRVLDVVAAESGEPIRWIIAPECFLGLMRPRQVAYLMYHKIGYSNARIGRIIGGRDPSTISHGIKRAEELRKTDPAFAKLYRACEARLEAAR